MIGKKQSSKEVKDIQRLAYSTTNLVYGSRVRISSSTLDKYDKIQDKALQPPKKLFRIRMKTVH